MSTSAKVPKCLVKTLVGTEVDMTTANHCSQLLPFKPCTRVCQPFDYAVEQIDSWPLKTNHIGMYVVSKAQSCGQSAIAKYLTC